MPNPLKILRSSVAGLRPTGKTPGELYVNFADGVVGYIDEAGQPVDIDTSGGGPAYVLPPATPTVLGGVMPDGTTITVAADGAITSPDQDLSGYLPLTGGVLTGPLEGTDATFEGVTIDSAATPTLFADEAGAPLWELRFGATTADFVTPLNSTPTMMISRSSGHVFINGIGAMLPAAPAGGGSASLRLNKNAAVDATNVFTGYREGLPRWATAIGNETVETGGSAGTDFTIQGYNDAGNISPFTPLTIKRSTGVCTFSSPIVETSDVATKSNVTSVEAALDIVNRLTGVFYNQYDNPKRQVGLIAQDTQGVLPEVVFQAPPSEGGEGLLGVAYGSLVAVLVEAIKELSAKVTALEGGAPAREVTVNTVNVQPRARPRR